LNDGSEPARRRSAVRARSARPTRPVVQCADRCKATAKESPGQELLTPPQQLTARPYPLEKMSRALEVRSNSATAPRPIALGRHTSSLPGADERNTGTTLGVLHCDQRRQTFARTTDLAFERPCSCRDDGSASAKAVVIDAAQCRRRPRRQRPSGCARRGRHIFRGAWRAYRRYRRRRRPRRRSYRTVQKFARRPMPPGAESSAQPL